MAEQMCLRGMKNIKTIFVLRQLSHYCNIKIWVTSF